MIIVDDTEEGGHGLELMIRRLSLEELDDGASQAPDVGGGGGAGQLDDLGSHPVRCPDDARLVKTGGLGGDAEIGQFDHAVLGGEDVGPFDITMDDALIMEIEQPLQDL